MLDYEGLKQDERKFVALTGISPSEFQRLLPAFTRAYARAFPSDKTQAGKPRRRRPGGGRKAVLLRPEDKLLFILVYQKAYPLQELLGSLFDLSQSQVNRWVHRLLPILVRALDRLGFLPERDPGRFSRHERRQGEAPELIIDGTERRRQRPKNPEKQRLHYSGKKKAHSDKNVVVVNARSKRVGYLSGTYPGKTHDKKVAEGEAIRYPRQATLLKDTGFQGYEPAVRQTCQPKKSPGAGP
jgi:Helix-turn-helix of DDE superfamily endonuclease/DDE superfamily endonuclease